MSGTKGRGRESHRPQPSAAATSDADDGEDGLRVGEPGDGDGLARFRVREGGSLQCWP